MRIAVTGASGHIGSEICRQLLSQGYEVRALVHRNIEAIENLPIEIVRGGLLDPKTLLELFKDCDIVIHTAGLIRLGYQFDQEVYDINVKGTQQVIETAIKCNIKRLIHFSSIEAYNPYPKTNPITEKSNFVDDKAIFYGQTKRDSHLLALEASKELEVIIVCPTSVLGSPDFGPSKLGKAIQDIYRGKLFTMVDGGFNFVDVRDLAAGVISCIHHGRSGETYLLGGTDSSIKELGNLVLKLKGTRRRLLHLPLFWAYVGLPFVKVFAWLSRSEPLYDKPYIDILQNSNSRVSSEKAKDELAYKTRPLEETIKDALDWFKNNGKL